MINLMKFNSKRLKKSLESKRNLKSKSKEEDKLKSHLKNKQKVNY